MVLKPSKDDIILGTRISRSESRKMSTLVKRMDRVNARMLKAQREYIKAERTSNYKNGMVEPPSVRKKSKEGFKRVRELIRAGKILYDYKKTLKRKYNLL